MKMLKVAVLGIQFTEENLQTWKMVKDMDFLKDVEIHLVHISGASDHVMNSMLNLTLYPAQEARVIIEHAVTLKLEALAAEILPADHSGKVHVKCLFSSHPKKEFCDYANKVGSSLVILAADKNKKISMGSFIQYQSLHSRSAVLVLREKNEL